MRALKILGVEYACRSVPRSCLVTKLISDNPRLELPNVGSGTLFLLLTITTEQQWAWPTTLANIGLRSANVKLAEGGEP